MSEDKQINISDRFRVIEVSRLSSNITTYSAIDKETRQPVSIKTLKKHQSDDKMRNVFQKEYEVFQRLRDPKLPHIIDWLEDDSTVYVVTESTSTALKELVKRQSDSSLEETVKLATKLLDELRSGSGLITTIHRDLKPSNVLVQGDKKNPLIDFDTGSDEEDDKIVSKLEYIAPEVFEGELPDSATDIWALGVIMYEMLSGTSPFEEQETREPTRSELPDKQPYNTLGPIAPGKLSELVSRMMSKSPSERPQKLSEVDKILSEVIEESGGHEKVAFTHFYPAEISAGQESPLHIYVHLISLLEQVRQDFEKRKNFSSPALTSTTETEAIFKRGTRFKIIPSIKNARVIPSSLELEWVDDIEHVQFSIKPDISRSISTGITGKIRIFVDTGIVAELPMIFNVSSGDDKTVQQETNFPFSKVFISYSHKDEAVVKAVVQLYKKYAELDTYVDYLFLKSGEKWWDGIKEKIMEAEALQLFWSENASRSENVENEWRFAYENDKLIVPIMLKPEPPIPPELSEIHFEPFDQFISSF